MDKLLKWSLNAANAPQGEQVDNPDPELLSQLFGGKDEVQQMKDNMTVILHPEAEKEDKMTALDNFEMLIENLDNANNIEPLGMWQHLIGLLDSHDDDIRRMACWIIGTAVQNNPPAQKHLLESRPLEVIPKLLAIFAESTASSALQVKALYALTSELGHNEAAYDAFVLADGWTTIEHLLNNEKFSNDPKVRARTISLLRVLLTIEPVSTRHSAFRESANGTLVPTLVGPLHLDASAMPDIRERTLELIGILVEAGFEFTEEEKKQAKILIDQLRASGDIEKEEYLFFLMQIKQLVVICS